MGQIVIKKSLVLKNCLIIRQRNMAAPTLRWRRLFTPCPDSPGDPLGAPSAPRPLPRSLHHRNLCGMAHAAHEATRPRAGVA